MSTSWIARLIKSALLVITLSLLALQAASADPNLVLDRIRNSGELRVPVMVGEEPGFIRDRDTGAWSGYYYEWAEDIANLLGVKVVPVESTWGNIAADFEASKIDLVVILNPNPRRGLVVDYVNASLFNDAWAIVANSGFDKKTWAELNDPAVRIVVQKGSTMQTVAENLTPKAQIIVVEERPLGILEMKAGRADAMLLNIIDSAAIAKQIGGDVIMPAPALRVPSMIGVKREDGNEGLLNFLANWTHQQRMLGLAQGKLAKSFEAAGIDLSMLPSDFSF